MSARVHLELYRDPRSGRESFGFAQPLFEERWQNEVAASAVNTTAGVLGETATLERILELTRRAMSSTSRLVLGLLAQAPRGEIACRAGCDHCCHVVVGVTAPEALTIFDHLRRTLSSDAWTRLSLRIARFLEETRGLPSAARFSPRYPCVFLEAGCCSIYEVRPFACRGMNSLDARECEVRLHDPEARARFAEHGGGRLFLEPVRAFRAVSAGLQLGLAELYGLDMRPLELCAALHALLQGGPSVVTAWISGGRPFDAALQNRQPTEVSAHE